MCRKHYALSICHARNFDVNFMQMFSNFLADNFVQLSPLLGIWLGFQTLSNLLFSLRWTNIYTVWFFLPWEVMKPWQAFFCRASSKGGKEEERKDPSRKPKNPNWATKGQGNKLCSRDPPPVVRSISGKERERPGINTGSKDSTSLVWSDTIPTLVPLDVIRDMSFYILYMNSLSLCVCPTRRFCVLIHRQNRQGAVLSSWLTRVSSRQNMHNTFPRWLTDDSQLYYSAAVITR